METETGFNLNKGQALYNFNDLQGNENNDDGRDYFPRDINTASVYYSMDHEEPFIQNEHSTKDSTAFSELTLDERGPSTSLERETWSRSLDFILSLLGYAVGLGNLWRFPYLCVRNGGGAFLFPFIICLVTIGLPLFFLEVSLGQFLGQSSIHAWAMCPLFKGIGIGMMIMTGICTIYYNVLIAWSMYYFVNAFNPTLPWSICDGWWNTENCVLSDTSSQKQHIVQSNSSNKVMYNVTSNATTAMMSFSSNKTMSSEEEFWQYNTLQITSGLGDFGALPWHLVVSFLCAWILVFLCVMKGVKSIGKVVYVTALLPYVLLLVLLIRGLTLEGSIDGVIYYFKPNLQKMMTARVWIEAALQVFYSLGAAWGPLITMASYNKFSNNCLRDSVLICFLGEGTSVFSGVVVFTVLGFISHELQLPIEEVVKSGPGLGFVVYPQALARLPISNVWSVLFFLMLITIGLDSEFSCVETVVSGIIDVFPRLQKRRLLVSMAACVAGFLVGLPMCLQGGMYLFQLLDWYIAIISVPMFGLLECIMVAWIYGAERYSRDVELMLGRGVPIFIRICWCFITPVAIIICLVFTLMTYVPPSYGEYEYPAIAQIFGWVFGALPLIPVVVVAVNQIRLKKDRSLKEALMINLTPSEEWKPHSADHQKTYCINTYSYNNASIIRRLKINLFGDNEQ